MRSRIASAGWALFSEHGFDNVTMSQIADAAEVSIRTLHSYFGSKVGIYFASTDWVDGHAAALASASEGSDPMQILARDLVGHYPGAEQYETRELKIHAAGLWSEFEHRVTSILTDRKLPDTSRFENRLEAAMLVTLIKSLQWAERHMDDTPYPLTRAGQDQLVADYADEASQMLARLRKRRRSRETSPSGAQSSGSPPKVGT